MKRILSLLASIGLVGSSASAIVSCSTNKPKIVKEEIKEEPKNNNSVKDIEEELAKQEQMILDLNKASKKLADERLFNALKYQNTVDDIEKVNKEIIEVQNKGLSMIGQAKEIEKSCEEKENKFNNLLNEVRKLEETSYQLKAEILKIEDASKEILELIPTVREPDPVLLKDKEDLIQLIDMGNRERKELLDKDNYLASQKEKLMSDIENEEDKVANANKELNFINDEIRDLDVKIRTKKEVAEDLKGIEAAGMVPKIEKEIAELKKKKSALEAKLSDISEMGEDHINELKAKLSRTLNEEKETINKLAGIQRRIDSFREALKNKEIEIKNSIDNFFERNKREIDFLWGIQKERSKTANPLRNKLAENEVHIDDLKVQAESITNEMELLNSQSDQLDKESVDLNNYLIHLNNKYNSLVKEKKHLFDLVNNQQKQIEEYKTQTITMQDKYNDLKAKLEIAKQRGN